MSLPNAVTAHIDWVIPDLHGNDVLSQLALRRIGNDPAAQLGDLVDRGDDSFKVALDWLARPRTTLLRGNHERMLHDALRSRADNDPDNWDTHWLEQGGNATLRSAGTWERLAELDQQLTARQVDTALVTHPGLTVILGHAARPAMVGARQYTVWYARPDNDTMEPWADSLKFWPAHTPRFGDRQLSVHGHTPQLEPTVRTEIDGSFSAYIDLLSFPALDRQPALGLLHLPSLTTHVFRSGHWTVAPLALTQFGPEQSAFNQLS